MYGPLRNFPGKNGEKGVTYAVGQFFLKISFILFFVFVFDHFFDFNITLSMITQNTGTLLLAVFKILENLAQVVCEKDKNLHKY